MHLCSTLLTCSPAPSTHESGLVNIEVLKKTCEWSEQKNFHGLTNPKMLPPALSIALFLCRHVLPYIYLPAAQHIDRDGNPNHVIT